MSEAINICGVLIHAMPDKVTEVKQTLLEYEGLEIHTVTEDGRMVITLDYPDRGQMMDTINQLNSVAGVLSAAMVYQHNESNDIDIKEQEASV
ncbi:MAG: chaperone NapD [Gammaproteobacteria bacterium]|nr:chaperone NapD [Gammaproteobacteria bacterium]